LSATDDACRAMNDLHQATGEHGVEPAWVDLLAAVPDEVLVRYAVERGALWCANCDGRRCMACVLRYLHDACEDDCPACCLGPGSGWRFDKPTLGSVLPQGWAR